MDGDDLNDNEQNQGAVPAEEGDHFGDVALLLVESLLHGLIARSLISVEDAVEIVSVAASVKEDTGAERGEAPGTVARALVRLEAISSSLKLDIQRE